MFKTTTLLLLIASATLSLSGKPAEASYPTWVDTYYDYDLYYGVRETVYDLYVVYEDGTEKVYHRYTSSSSLSSQMKDFARGFLPSADIVSWYSVTETDVARWYRYSHYATWSQADSNAAWLEEMGYETDIRLVYNPIFVRD